MEVVPEARLDVRAMAGDEEDDKEEGGEDESGAEEDAEAAGVGDDGVDEEGVVGEQNEAEEDDGEAEADDAAASDEEDGGSKVQPTTAVAPGRPRHVNIRVRDEEGKPITRKVQYRRRQYKPRAATDIFAFGMKEMKRKNVKRRRQKQAERYRRKRDAIAEMYATQEAMAQRSDVLQPLMEQDLKMPVAHRVALRSLWEDAGNEVAFSSEP